MLKSSAVVSSPPAVPTSLSDRAAADLRFIRQTMAHAAAFTAVSGTGYLAIGAGALISAWFAGRVSTPAAWLLIWIADALLSIGVGMASTLRKAHRARQPLLTGAFRKFALGFAPVMLVGSVMTGVLWTLRAYDVLPGLWLLCYGAGLIAGGAYSVPVVPLMGVCFLALGIAAAWWAPQIGALAMVAGFGGLHVIFGIVLVRRYGG